MSFLIQCDGCGTITPARPSEYRDHEHDSIGFVVRVGRRCDDEYGRDHRPRKKVHACSEACARKVAERYHLAVLSKPGDGSQFRAHTMFAKVVRRAERYVSVRTQYDRDDTIKSRWSTATGECLGVERIEREFQIAEWRMVYPAPTGAK